MKITRLVILSAALATGVFAQPSAPAPTPAATPSDPAKLALAREVIAVMKADKMFDSMAAQMKESAAQITAVPADATPEVKQKSAELQEKIVTLVVASAKDLTSKMDQIYADVFTEAELHAMKSFFSSPEGASMLAKQPQVMQHVMPLVQAMQRDLYPKVQQLVEEAKLPPPMATPTPGGPSGTPPPMPTPPPAK